MNLRYNKATPTKSPEIPYGWKQQGGTEAGHQHLTALFDTVSTTPIYDGNERAWDTILELLNLPLCYQPAIAKVLGEGRWRQTKNPKAYVATAAYHQGLAMRLKEFPDRDFKVIDASEVNDDGEHGIDVPTDAAGDERISDVDWGDVQTHRYKMNHGECSDDSNDARIPKWLQCEEEYDRVDWDVVAGYAALKPNMVPALRLTLNLRFNEKLSRDAAMKRVAKTGQRPKVQAAWKWIDRHWKTRIVPLFGMERAPSPEQSALQSRSETFIPPWEALRNVRQTLTKGQNHIDYVSAPSIETQKRPSLFNLPPGTCLTWGQFGQLGQELSMTATLCDEATHREAMACGGNRGEVLQVLDHICDKWNKGEYITGVFALV